MENQQNQGQYRKENQGEYNWQNQNQYGRQYGQQQYGGNSNQPQYTGQYNPYGQQQAEYNPGQYGQQQQVQYNPGQYGQQQYQQQQPLEVKNPQTNIVPQVKGPEMNDCDYLNDILANEKYLTDNFNVFTREASHMELYNDIKQILNETHDCERELFNLMFKDGFYSMKAAPRQEIQQAQQKFTGYLNSQNPYRPNDSNNPNNPEQEW